jgi:hypothetical protein
MVCQHLSLIGNFTFDSWRRLIGGGMAHVHWTTIQVVYDVLAFVDEVHLSSQRSLHVIAESVIHGLFSSVRNWSHANVDSDVAETCLDDALVSLLFFGLSFFGEGSYPFLFELFVVKILGIEACGSSGGLHHSLWRQVMILLDAWEKLR